MEEAIKNALESLEEALVICRDKYEVILELKSEISDDGGDDSVYDAEVFRMETNIMTLEDSIDELENIIG